MFEVKSIVIHIKDQSRSLSIDVMFTYFCILIKYSKIKLPTDCVHVGVRNRVLLPTRDSFI
jgi:hypothetical protein